MNIVATGLKTRQAFFNNIQAFLITPGIRERNNIKLYFLGLVKYVAIYVFISNNESRITLNPAIFFREAEPMRNRT